MIRLSCITLLNSQHFFQFKHFRFSTFWFKPSPFSKSPVKCQNTVGQGFWSSTLRYLCPTKSSSFEKFWWRHCMWFEVCPPPNQKSWLLLWPVPNVMFQTTAVCIIIRFRSRWKTQTNKKLSTIEWFATLWNNSDSTSDWQSLLLSPLLSPLLFKAAIAMSIDSSSVARGGGATVSSIGLKSMQNSTFLVLLRPIFAPKIITVSQRDWGAEVVKDLLLFGPEKWSFFELTEFWWRPFFLF